MQKAHAVACVRLLFGKVRNECAPYDQAMIFDTTPAPRPFAVSANGLVSKITQ
jgi:hypothetical protein